MKESFIIVVKIVFPAQACSGLGTIGKSGYSG